MTTAELITPPWASSPTDPRPAACAFPTFGEIFAGILPLVGVIPVAGPPVVFLAGPWLLFALLLAGPFAVLVTVVALLMAAAALVGLIRAILAAPYRLFHHRSCRRRAGHASLRAPTVQLVVRRGTA